MFLPGCPLFVHPPDLMAAALMLGSNFHIWNGFPASAFLPNFCVCVCLRAFLLQDNDPLLPLLVQSLSFGPQNPTVGDQELWVVSPREEKPLTAMYCANSLASSMPGFRPFWKQILQLLGC